MFCVRDLMSADLFTLRDSDTLKAARSMMELARIRHIPIVDASGVFVGLVTHRDILAAAVSRLADLGETEQEEIEASIPIAEIMRRDVRIIEPEAQLIRAARILLHNKYGCLPVVDGDSLVGILTEADFLRLSISLMEALEARQEDT